MRVQLMAMIARNEPNTNVVFHQAALGDFVLLWPLLRALKSPTVVVSDWSKAMLASEVFAHVEPMDAEMLEFARLYAEGGPTHISPAVTDLFESAKRIISFISTGDDAWATNVRRLAPRAAVYFVRPRPACDWTEHVTQWHEAQLAQQDWKVQGNPICDAVSRDGPIVIHPGSGGPGKVWPTDRFVELAAALRKRGQTVRVVVGEVEVEKWSLALLEKLQAEPLRTLEDLCAVLATASVYIGNDAGPTHLAAQLGLPTVALFGPTQPQVWAPPGPAVTVIAPDSPCEMDWLSVDAAIAGIEDRVSGFGEEGA